MSVWPKTARKVKPDPRFKINYILYAEPATSSYNSSDDCCKNCGGDMSSPYTDLDGHGQKQCTSCYSTVSV